MREDILDEAKRRKLFLSPKAVDILDSNGYSLEFVNTVLNALSKNGAFINEKQVEDFLNGDGVLFETQRTIRPPRPNTSDIKVIEGSDITGNSTCTGTIEDFTNYFRSRYNQLKKILLARKDFDNPVPIEKAKEYRRECNIVGMVYETRSSKNGHTMVTVEDEKTTITVLVRKGSPIENELFVTDEVVGFHGTASNKGDLFFADAVFRPDIPADHRWERSDSQASIAFLSDIHIGSHEFLTDKWEKMITWLKQNSEESQLNYIVMPGDVVDGIGAYPDQEKDLDILDIYEQYDALAEYIKDIPDHIKIILHPGNHDACRLAEPQPALASIYTGRFDSNVTLTGNPINLKVEGRVVTSYHGKSIDDWISGVRGMSYEDPLAVMKEM